MSGPAAPKAGLTPRRKELARGGVIMLLALLASWGSGASALGHFSGRLFLDPLIRWDAPIDETEIVLVDITEDDYEKVFKKSRPLDPATIVDLITAAHAGGAKLIAVDISTADWPRDWEKRKGVKPLPLARIVWARGFYQERDQRRAEYVLEPILGGVHSAETECYGVPALAQEAGIVRSFYSNLAIGSHVEPSFVQQIVYRTTHDSCLAADEGGETEIIINFSSRIRSESASTLLAESRQPDWGRRPEYADKIVILGGTFHSGADIHDTPLGTKAGFEIIGQAVSSVRRGNFHSELGETLSLLIDLVIGVGLLIGGIFVKAWVRVFAYVAMAAALFLSLYLFRQYYLFVSFLPFIVGILAHYRLEQYHAPQPSS